MTPENGLLLENVLLYALFGFGLIVTGYWSYQAFTRRQFELEETPTLPQYMARKPLFLYGMAVFIVLSLCIYGLIVFFFEDLFPLLQHIHKPTYDFIIEAKQAGSLTLPLIIVVAAAIFVALLKIENRFNLVLIVRNIVHSWAAIPRKTAELVSSAREALDVPVEERKAVASDADTPFVSLGDFKKNRDTLERKWAESSYMKRWLSHQEASGLHASFFREPTLLWDDVRSSFDRAAQEVGGWCRKVGGESES